MRVIDTITGALGKLPKGYSKIGDDVATVPTRRGKLVLKVDMLVEHTDVPRGMSYRQAGPKAVAMCVRDYAAKGVDPDSFMASVGLRCSVTQEEVDGLALGFRDAEREWGVIIVGGDTNEADELVIDCAMVGFAQKVVTRGGARAGDALVVTGAFGYPPAGLLILGGKATARPSFEGRARFSVLRPTPNLRVGRALAPYLTSAMDSSDGLARSIHTLARESAVGFDVTILPAGEGVGEFASANGVDLEKLVLEGGEEYIIVGTVSRSKLKAAKAAARRAGGSLADIGSATGREGRVVFMREGEAVPMNDSGWTHLR